MRPDKTLQYTAAAGFFFGVALTLSLGGRTYFDYATAVATLGCSLVAVALAVIAHDEDGRGRR